MAKDFTTKFKFTGDADGVEKATGQAGGAFGNLNSKMASAAKGIVGAMAVAFATDKLVGWGKELYNIGNQAELWNKKAGIVFGDQIGAMEEWAGGVAGAMGLTKSELLGASAAMGDLLVPMGATREEAATMSQDMMGLSGALSAWSGGTRSAAEVSEILSKALLGETDGLKGLGISISAAEVQTRALEIAQAAGRDEVTQMDKALATQQLTMEKSVDAQTAWADGTFAAQQKQAELSATVKELKEKLGTALLPVIQSVTAWLVDSAIPALQEFKEWMWPKLSAAFGALSGWWNDNGPTIVGFLTDVKDAAVEFGQGVQSMWDQHIGPALSQLRVAFGQLWGQLSGLFKAAGDGAASMGINWQRVGQVIGLALTVVIRSITTTVQIISGMIRAVQSAAGFIQSAASRISSAFSPIVSLFQRLYDAFNRFRNLVAGGIRIPKINWPSPPKFLKGLLPGFHSGTHAVPGAPGANVPAVLQAGEVVLSKGQVRQGAGGGGMTVVVNAYGATGREMVAEIERAVRDGVRSSWLTTAGIA